MLNNKKIYTTLNKQIMKNIIYCCFVIINITYIIMILININASKSFNKEKLENEMKIVSSLLETNKFINIKNYIKTLPLKDKYINKIIIDGEQIYSTGTPELFQSKFKIRNKEVIIYYDNAASYIYTTHLQIIILLLILSLIILIYFISKRMSKLFKPFEEIMKYTNTFKVDKPKHLYFSKENIISEEFLKIKTEFNHIIDSLISKNNEINKLANTDSLTNLNNRLNMEIKINDLINKNKYFSILFLDLDGFKRVNDSLGHYWGDKILIQASKLLLRIFPKENVFRIGGDEFIIIKHTINKEELIKSSKTILNTFRKFVFFENEHDLIMTTSIGIAMFGVDGNKLPVLLKKSDIALYKSKEKGKNTFSFFENKMEKEIQLCFKLEKEIKKAIKNDEFIIHFQPQINTHNGTTYSAETLIRWNHPKRGLTYPNYFIDFLENSIFMVEVGEIILKKSMLAVCEIKKFNLYNITFDKISINISVKQLEDKNFFNKVLSMLSETNCNPEWLEFEITERIIMENNEIIKTLNKIKDIGISISIDDFGTGYSSLSIIDSLPIDKLKIDKSFIDNIDNKKSIIDFIINLSKSLNLKIIAEGVEKEYQVKLLQDKGCFNIQGYYYSKPLSFENLEEFLFNKDNKDNSSI